MPCVYEIVYSALDEIAIEKELFSPEKILTSSSALVNSHLHPWRWPQRHLPSLREFGMRIHTAPLYTHKAGGRDTTYELL